MFVIDEGAVSVTASDIRGISQPSPSSAMATSSAECR
jgi:hypothetical protein